MNSVTFNSSLGISKFPQPKTSSDKVEKRSDVEIYTSSITLENLFQTNVKELIDITLFLDRLNEDKTWQNLSEIVKKQSATSSEKLIRIVNILLNNFAQSPSFEKAHYLQEFFFNLQKIANQDKKDFLLTRKFFIEEVYAIWDSQNPKLWNDTNSVAIGTFLTDFIIKIYNDINCNELPELKPKFLKLIINNSDLENYSPVLKNREDFVRARTVFDKCNIIFINDINSVVNSLICHLNQFPIQSANLKKNLFNQLIFLIDVSVELSILKNSQRLFKTLLFHLTPNKKYSQDLNEYIYLARIRIGLFNNSKNIFNDLLDIIEKFKIQNLYTFECLFGSIEEKNLPYEITKSRLGQYYVLNFSGIFSNFLSPSIQNNYFDSFLNFKMCRNDRVFYKAVEILYRKTNYQNQKMQIKQKLQNLSKSFLKSKKTHENALLTLTHLNLR